MPNTPPLDVESIRELVRGYQPACVLIAGAELDVFTHLHAEPMTATQLATRIHGELRATRVLLDALVALGALRKEMATDPVYTVTEAAAEALTETGSASVLGMVRHQGNCLRRWAELAAVVQTGKPADSRPGIRGEAGALESFIRAMHEVSGPAAEPLIRSLSDISFTHLLDVGGASGTWTISFLRHHPHAQATIFDRPDVIPMARQLMEEIGLADRVSFVAGDFNSDPLPVGSDMAWVSAIVHQNSRAQNRALFEKVFAALEPGGQILIRDIVMDATRTSPESGALFAVNMLVATDGGGTFTFDELQDDLASAGFVQAKLLHRAERMDSIVSATKPSGS